MENFSESLQAINEELACLGCGALLKFKPGTTHLVCDHCGSKNEIPIPQTNGNSLELDLENFFSKKQADLEKMETATVKCDGCGATTTLPPKVSSDKCPFCSQSLVIKSGNTSSLHKPQYLLPFMVENNQALSFFKKWMNKLWFAPGDLKRYASQIENLKGMYLPYWTFDCQTQTSYRGQRGENYQETKTITVMENGKNVNRTIRETKTRWYPAAGEVAVSFDDVLIAATPSLPKEKLQAPEPWDHTKLVTYDDRFLSGFITETYSLPLKSALEESKIRMEPGILSQILQDIGGDQQLIQYKSTTYNNPTFKHILLPVWISSYRYNQKVYQFLVNAQTGEVQGQRPYSVLKITLTIFTALAVIVLLVLFLKN